MSVYQDQASEDDQELAQACPDDEGLIAPARRVQIVRVLEGEADRAQAEGLHNAAAVAFRAPDLAELLNEPLDRALMADIACLAHEGLLNCATLYRGAAETGIWQYISHRLHETELDNTLPTASSPEIARSRRLRAQAKRRRGQIIARDGEWCQRYGATETLAVDHVIPISKGGESNIENLQLLCKSCNTRKKDHV